MQTTGASQYVVERRSLVRVLVAAHDWSLRQPPSPAGLVRKRESSGQDRRSSSVPAGGSRSVLPVTSNRKRRPSIGKWARWLAVAIAVAGIIYLLVWHVPDTLARRHTDPAVESAYISAVATFLGVGATAAVAIFAFWYSRATNRATLDAAKAATDETVRAAWETNQATLEATREGQLADRYSRAIEQLGSDKLDMRIGGIYALERVARDSAKDHPTVMEVLAAFVREHSREIWPPEASDEPRADAPVRTTRPDVQAAVTVIGRRNPQNDRQPVNLDDSNLTRVNLTDARLTGSSLNRANFTGARLTGADLTGANLLGANFSRAWLMGANFTRADLSGAIVGHANLTGAILTDARLAAAPLHASTTRTLVIGVGATLSGSDLTRATLTGADLTGADVTGVRLTGADLTGALWPPGAVVPDGWQRDADSGGLKRADTNSNGAATN